MLRFFFFFFALSITLNATDFSKKNPPPTVRVLLSKLADDALIEIRGRYLIYNPKNEELIATGTKKKRARIVTHENGIYWDELFLNTYEIRLVPNEENASILVNGIQYKGCIEIYSIGGTINIVNEVDTENYLKSILSKKINLKLSKETLDAIVISERTNLFYLIEKDAYASWQVEASAEGYTGLVVGRHNPAVNSSINRTRNLIMHYKKRPFETSWSENHAGRSVSLKSVHRKHCSCPRGVDNLPSLNTREQNRFRSTIPSKTLNKITGLSSITEIDLFLAEKSKKVYAVRFLGPEGRKDISFFDLQKKLGKDILPSNDFTISLKGKKAFITGYGKGLGIGICAFSAEFLAQRKTPAQKILKILFPDAELLNLREESGSQPNTSFIWN